MDKAQFETLMQPVMAAIAGREVGPALEKDLEQTFPAGGAAFTAIEKACHAAIEAGWMCAQGGEGRRFGRVIEASDETFDLSVDVVDLTDFVGPHHEHPRGEVCLTMPVTDTAKFDGRGAGWCVYRPGTDHRPTVSEGRALVLYLLPGGEINFTGK